MYSAAAPASFLRPFHYGSGGSGPASLRTADVDGDGNLDLIVGNQLTPNSGTRVLFGDGHGGIRDISAPIGDRPVDIVAADLDGDAKTDLVILDIFAGAGLGPDPGTSGVQHVSGVLAYVIKGSCAPNAIAVGDLDGDGKRDLVSVGTWCGGSTKLSLQLGTGTGDFGARTDLATLAGNASAVNVADLNNDGKLDIVVTTDAAFLTFLGDGSGHVGGPINTATGAVSVLGQPAIADVNNDGKPDIVFSRSTSAPDSFTISTLPGAGDGTFGPRLDMFTAFHPGSPVVGDFNADGEPDVAFVSYSWLVTVAAGDGTGRFGNSPSSVSTFPTDDCYENNNCTLPGPIATSLVAADLNHTGRLDLVVSQRAAYNVAVFFDSTTPVPTIVNPAAGSTFADSSVMFTWTAPPGVPGAPVTQYWIDIGMSKGGADVYSRSQGTALGTTVNGLPITGSTVYVRLWALVNGGWVYSDSTYATQPAAARLVGPASGATLAAASVTFTWSPGHSALSYWLDVGTTPGGTDVYSATQGASLSRAVTNIPLGGQPIYVRLWSLFSDRWAFADYTFQTGSTAGAVLTNPPQGTQLNTSSVTFNWSGIAGARAYWLDIGTSRGGSDVYGASQGTGLMATVGGLPVNGRPLYARLWTLLSDRWESVDYMFATLDQGSVLFRPPFRPVLEYHTGGTAALQLRTADVDGDGHTDIVIGNDPTGISTDSPSSTAGVRVLYGDGTGGIRDMSAPIGIHPRMFEARDLDGDGKADLVVHDPSAPLAGLQTISGVRAYVIKDLCGYEIGVGDVSGDGVADLVFYPGCSSSSPYEVVRRLGTGTGDFGSDGLFSPVDDFIYSLSMADVNQDGRDDVILTNTNRTTLLIDGRGGTPVAIPTAAGDHPPVFADVNNDGRPDMVFLRQSGQYWLSVVLGNGDGTFGPRLDTSVPAFETGPDTPLAVADFNGDGNLDVAFMNPKNMVTVVLGDGSGYFTSTIGLSTIPIHYADPYPNNVRLRSIAATDFNNDGAPDIIVTQAYLGSSTVAVLLNAFVKMTSPAPDSAFDSTTVTFTWTRTDAVSAMWLDVGTVIGGNQIYGAPQGLDTSRTVTGISQTGQPVYVRLWALTARGWQFVDYTYTALAPVPAGMLTPPPGSTLAGSTATFTWTRGTALSQIWLDVGTTPGGNQIYAGTQGSLQSRTIAGLPTSGQPVYVRLWSLSSAGWNFTDYTYTAALQ